MSAGVVYLLATRHPDTVEYHVGAYMKACEIRDSDVWVETRGPEFLRRWMDERRNKRVEKHRKALIRLRFLQQSTIVVSNASAADIMFKALHDYLHRTPTGPFFHWDIKTTNSIQITVPPDGHIWTNLIRNADVPATKEWMSEVSRLKGH